MSKYRDSMKLQETNWRWWSINYGNSTKSISWRWSFWSEKYSVEFAIRSNGADLLRWAKWLREYMRYIWVQWLIEWLIEWTRWLGSGIINEEYDWTET